MFGMITNQAVQECSKLDRQGYELSMQSVELEQVIGELRGLSGMEDIIMRLRTQQEQLEQEHTVLRQMMQGLERAVYSYERCERKICDAAEQNIVLYARQEIGVNDFTQITNILNGMGIR